MGEELLAPGWLGPRADLVLRADLVPGRGWQSSVLSSRRLQTHPAAQQPQEQRPRSRETDIVGADLFALC